MHASVVSGFYLPLRIFFSGVNGARWSVALSGVPGIVATGWFKLSVPYFEPGQSPRRLCKLDPEMLHTYCVNPCQSFEGLSLSAVFFVRYLVVFCCSSLFLDFTASREKKQISRKKKSTNQTPSDFRQGRKELVCKLSGSCSRKQRGHLDFGTTNCTNLRRWLAIYLYQYYCKSFLAGHNI